MPYNTFIPFLASQTVNQSCSASNEKRFFCPTDFSLDWMKVWKTGGSLLMTLLMKISLFCAKQNNLTFSRYLGKKLGCALSNFYLKFEVTIINGTFIVLMFCFVIQKCKLQPLPLRKSYPAMSHFSFFHL